jgi:hypothetical protein
MDKRVSNYQTMPAYFDNYLGACREILFIFFVLSSKYFLNFQRENC